MFMLRKKKFIKSNVPIKLQVITNDLKTLEKAVYQKSDVVQPQTFKFRWTE